MSSKFRLNLRALADVYEQVIKVRNACANRLRAVEQGKDDPGPDDLVADYPLLNRLNEALSTAQEDMERVLPEHPCYVWAMGVPGINRTVACKILGVIPMESPEDFATFSQLRTFAGICPERNKLVKGEKACFSRRLKTTLYVAWSSMLKAEAVSRGSAGSPARFYAEIYRKWREIYKQRYGEGEPAKKAGWPDGRQHHAAKNKLLDVFLCHLWRTWREALGYDVATLYVHEKLGHHMDYAAEEFNSPIMAARKIKQHQRKRRKDNDE